MERTMWTDERLDDLAQRVDSGFERVDKDIRELRADIGSLRLAILQVGGGLGIGLIGVIASILISSD
jgi:iron uptake system EfeUOB component EfeO/EfeM